MAKWKEAPAEIITMARKLIDDFHPELSDANIAILLKNDESDKPLTRFKIWATASKIPEKFKTLLYIDFLIWIQKEIWMYLDENGRIALLDHELCHCGFDPNENPIMIDHDIEEFSSVIERHGLWRKSLVEFGMVVDNAVEKYLQNPLFKSDTIIEHIANGTVTTLTGDQLSTWVKQKAL